MMSEKHLLIDYTNLLHKYRDPNAKPVLDYFNEAVKADPKFENRAKKLQMLFQGDPVKRKVTAGTAPGDQ